MLVSWVLSRHRFAIPLLAPQHPLLRTLGRGARRHTLVSLDMATKLCTKSKSLVV